MKSVYLSEKHPWMAEYEKRVNQELNQSRPFTFDTHKHIIEEWYGYQIEINDPFSRETKLTMSDQQYILWKLKYGNSR